MPWKESESWRSREGTCALPVFRGSDRLPNVDTDGGEGQPVSPGEGLGATQISLVLNDDPS